MKTRVLIVLSSAVLLACHSPMPEPPRSSGNLPAPAKERDVNAAIRSNAATLDEYKVEVARRIVAQNSKQVYSQNPQALLRAVIVLRYTLAADGRLVKTDIVRSNHDHAAENTALASLKQGAPFARPDARLLKGGQLVASETWLFNDDGRFQLRSIALPQLGDR